ncbi:MAG TPA: SDR family oxidoreductase [Marmoricola sp.]|jgi:NAD(P)-dependent dehydrogenase (short-subunit alcohol dehydrogenase family)|nr:SDR family oxidoreductase [Marmoricola sp.]
MSVALVTGGSAGLGRALVLALAEGGWTVIADGRDAERLREVAGSAPRVVPVAGDVTDADHRRDLARAVATAGRLDLLVHNASTLGVRRGGRTLRPLAEATPEDLQHVWRSNVGAPLALTAALLSQLVRSRGVLLSVTSDAGVDHYPDWGLYGASKAALEHLTLTFAAENPEISAYAVDPGDLRTRMHQEAFPGEDISDRPLPAAVVPGLLALVARRPMSGRYRAADFRRRTEPGAA